jgi:glycogen debranching enzyme
MDNTPRDMGRPAPDGDIHSATDAMGWIDMSSQIKMCYDNLAEICTILGENRKAKKYKKKAIDLSERINRYMWDNETGLYYDVDTASVRTPWITTATFWPMLAGISSPEQTACLVKAIKDESLFWRRLPLPSLAANQPYYDKCGCYWRGGVWAPTTYMTVKGLQKNGYEELATTIARKNMETMYKVFESTGTIWELYSPDMYMPATDATGVNMVKPDFVGWSGLIPISLFIENIIGIRADATVNRVVWHSTSDRRHGVTGLRFGDVETSLIREGNMVYVESNAPYQLSINGKEYRILQGKQSLGL